MIFIWTYGDPHDELWKLSDIDNLFAWVPLPYKEAYNVLIDVPEWDDALPATHSFVEIREYMYI